MATIVDGTDGVTTPGLVNTAGQTIATTLAVTGAITAASLRVNGIATNVYPLSAGTSVASTSGTSINFTSVPSWSKRITIFFRGVSTNNISNWQIQLGSSAGYVITGYAGVSMRAVAGATAAAPDTTGFRLQFTSAATFGNGVVTLSTYNNLIWYAQGNVGDTGGVLATFGGAVTLPGVLDRFRITTVNGTDAFDAGTISTMFE